MKVKDCDIANHPLRVVVTGAESTGKTTLALGLAEKLDGEYVSEYLREFVDLKGALPSEEDVFEIAQGFLERYSSVLAQGPPLVIFDTDLISTVVYQRHYFGNCPDEVVEASKRSESDVYLLCGDDIPWEADPGQRDGPEVRRVLQRSLRNELRERKLDYYEITGAHAERLDIAREVISARKFQ